MAMPKKEAEFQPKQADTPQAQGIETTPKNEVKKAEITTPKYQSRTGDETVSLVCNLKGETGQIQGRLEVALSFKYLMKDI